MKKILILLLSVVLFTQSFGAASTTVTTLKADQITLPIGSTGKTISLAELSTISVKDFQLLTGKHMSLFNKALFKIEQRKLRKSINDDGTINNNALKNLAKKDIDNSEGFNLGGFALGFLLGLIGVLIAYLIGGDNQHNRTKWAWIGFGIYVAILLVVLLV